jgi:hypothetical protein
MPPSPKRARTARRDAAYNYDDDEEDDDVDDDASDDGVAAQPGLASQTMEVDSDDNEPRVVEPTSSRGRGGARGNRGATRARGTRGRGRGRGAARGASAPSTTRVTPAERAASGVAACVRHEAGIPTGANVYSVDFQATTETVFGEDLTRATFDAHGKLYSSLAAKLPTASTLPPEARVFAWLLRHLIQTTLPWTNATLTSKGKQACTAGEYGVALCATFMICGSSLSWDTSWTYLVAPHKPAVTSRRAHDIYLALACMDPTTLGGAAESDDGAQWAGLTETRETLLDVERVLFQAPLRELTDTTRLALAPYVMDDQHLTNKPAAARLLMCTVFNQRKHADGPLINIVVSALTGVPNSAAFRRFGGDEVNAKVLASLLPDLKHRIGGPRIRGAQHHAPRQERAAERVHERRGREGGQGTCLPRGARREGLLV